MPDTIKTLGGELLVTLAEGELATDCDACQVCNNELIDNEGNSLVDDVGNILFDGFPADDSRCQYCDATPPTLCKTYTVVISGFPAICAADTFNGTWTVTWLSDCLWRYNINAFHQVFLDVVAGGLWRVSWRVNVPGGINGTFQGGTDADCCPQDRTWSFLFCGNVFGCFGLCASVQNNGVVTVSV